MITDEHIISRYIPTSVGRLVVATPSTAASLVHPHVCGEILRLDFLRLCQSGTSPRLWGDYIQTLESHVLSRYIPTSVGRLRELAA